MFEPIEAPDVHRGPATGHTTEYGTTWQEAVSRINAAFKTLFENTEASVSGESGDFIAAIEARFQAFDTACHDFFKVVEDDLSAMRADLAEHEAKIAFQEASLEAAIKVLVKPDPAPTA